MDEADRDSLRQLLLQQQKALLCESESLAVSSQPVMLDQTRVGRLSRMDAIQSQQLAIAAQKRNVQQLVNVENTLRQIELDSDEYGLCTECDRAIHIRRLYIDPTIKTCIECAEKQESV